MIIKNLMSINKSEEMAKDFNHNKVSDKELTPGVRSLSLMFENIMFHSISFSNLCLYPKSYIISFTTQVIKK